MDNKIKTAAYYFPNYHADSQNEAVHGKGWTEWELMKCARPRFEGHQQPKVPLWGYEDESDPNVMAKKIDTALTYGIDAFVFDWYWYDGPYLQRALDEGFLKADNCGKIKFALMWANHNWRMIHPVSRGVEPPILYKWSTSYETIGFVWDYIIERYFQQDNYWKVDGKPYFSIYAMNLFIKQMGGNEKTAEVIKLLKDKATDVGLPGVHISAHWFDNLDDQPDNICPTEEWHTRLGFDSYTSYNFPLYAAQRGIFPERDYDECADYYLPICENALKSLPAPYFPVVTAGWDCTPRITQSDCFENIGGYPYGAVIQTKPEQFERVLIAIQKILCTRPEKERILFINAWNEWTEGSYLEPDTRENFAKLEIIKKVLKS
ncbi:MAG: glycoside hydrolase family 99-like domain-containing protein [Victivallales bacterium]|nr:glycoside hydrolase family 99-like domain-containing protein [Victivallales bacterium]